MITGANGTKIPRSPQDRKGSHDTAPPAYSESLHITNADATPLPQPLLTIPIPAPTPPRTYDHPSTVRSPPSLSTGTHAYPSRSDPNVIYAGDRSAESGSPEESTSRSKSKPKSKSKSKQRSGDRGKEGEGGKNGNATGKVARAVSAGVLAVVLTPVVAAAAALYGSGKLVEGIGKGLSAGPEALLRAYRKDKDKDGGGEDGEEGGAMS